MMALLSELRLEIAMLVLLALVWLLVKVVTRREIKRDRALRNRLFKKDER
jgi:flagellar biogenesis protein FliO